MGKKAVGEVDDALMKVDEYTRKVQKKWKRFRDLSLRSLRWPRQPSSMIGPQRFPTVKITCMPCNLRRSSMASSYPCVQILKHSSKTAEILGINSRSLSRPNTQEPTSRPY